MASLLVTQKREENWTMLSIKLVEGCLQTYNGCRRDVKQMLLPCDLSVKGVDRSYLCRKSCFASLNKIINHEKNIAELTAEVKQIRQEFLKNVERLYPPIAELEMGTDPSTAVLRPPSAKRQCTTSRAVMAGCARPRALFSSSRSSQLTTHTTVASPRVTVSVYNLSRYGTISASVYNFSIDMRAAML